MEGQPIACPHFNQSKCLKAIFMPSHPECKRCGAGKDNLWLCLAKDCEQLHCGRRSFEHLNLHLEQSRKKRNFHSLFINILTAEIFCISCKVFIQDSKEQRKAGQFFDKSSSILKLRTQIVPFLAKFSDYQISGQIENSEAHRKISRGSVGIFSNQYNYTIHTALQFLSQCSYFADVILSLRVQQERPLLHELRQVMQQLDEARYRAIHTDVALPRIRQKLDELFYRLKPRLLTYQRKDPFELVLFLLQQLHEHLSYHTLPESHVNFEQDEWDIYYSKSQLRLVCPIYDSIEIKLKLNYFCSKCKQHEFYLKTINYLKLVISKKKRNAKEVEKELNQHRAESPLKKRRNSLANFFFREEQMPITIQELVIDLMRRPLHKDKSCEKCKEPLKKNKIQFQSLPNYLILQICRMSPEGYGIDDTAISFSPQDLDFGAFTVQKQKSQLYSFQAAIGVEKKGFYPVMARNAHNKLLQVFRNEHITFEDKLNPYIVCYKRVPSAASTERYDSLLMDAKQAQQRYVLPDFWAIKIKHNFQRQHSNPFICKHDSLKPGYQSKQLKPSFASAQFYRQICHAYNARRFHPISCVQCGQELERIELRRKKEREAIKKYDAVKTEVQCMISIEWINKWSAFLYKKGSPNYIVKGYPPPGRIDNSSILQGNQCKPYLVNNRDFKIVNYYVWRFLKELYGGGTEIRYKWKKDSIVTINEELVQQVKAEGRSLNLLLPRASQLSPSKKSSTMSQSISVSEQEHEPSKLQVQF